jgi:hypothetical protein
MGENELTPEMIESILALQQQEQERKKLNRQYQMAQAMRQQGMQGMGATSPGGGRVGAPNWAGTLANIYAHKKAGDMDREATARDTQMQTDERNAMKQYFQMQLRMQQQAAEREARAAALRRTSETPTTTTPVRGSRGSYVDDGGFM